MRIAVFGTGGVGGYFGGRLAQAGEQVIFIARGEHLHAMQTSGLRVDSIQGDFHLHPLQAVADPRQVGQVDFILIAVKAWQVPEAALAARPMVGEETAVIPLCNGVDAPVQLAAALGAEHVLGGMCQISALLAGPGHVRHTGIDPLVVFGELDNSPSERTQRLQQAFQRANTRATIPPDIQAAMWRKFIFIASVSGLGGVTRVPIAALRDIPETRHMLEAAIAEIVQIARARKIALPEDIASATLAFIDGIAPGVTASMQRDIMDGKPSELGSQNGAVVRMGLEMGIPTPLHTFIYHSLLPQELIARQEL